MSPLRPPFDVVLNWFQDRFRRAAEHRVGHFMPDGDQVLTPNEHYFRLWLDEMFLANDRDWFKSWHPAVHSAVTFTFGDEEQVITRIAGAATLKDVDATNLDRVIMQTLNLTELMPFRDGTIRINAALLAMQGTDDVKALIDVFGEFSKKLAIPQLSAALDVAAPLAQGVSALVGSTNGEMMAGIDHTLAGQEIRAGSFAIVFATAKEVPVEKLSVVKRKLLFNGAPLEGRNYMLLRIERVDARKDWDALAAIRDPYQIAIDMMTDGRLDAAHASLKKAIGAALKSKDLTEVDRRRVIDALRTRYEEAKDLIGSGAFAAETDKRLDRLMTNAMTPAQAAARGPIGEDEAMAGIQ